MQDEIKTSHPALDGFDVHYRTARLTAMDDPSRVQNIVSEFEDILRLLNIVLARRYCPTSQTNELPNFAKRKNIAV